jgi:hypothetical protein
MPTNAPDRSPVPSSPVPSFHPIARALSAPEMTAVYDAVADSASLAAIVSNVCTEIFSLLLAPLGESLSDYGPEHKLPVTDYAIPCTQREAIAAACLNRAQAVGGPAQITLELADVLPSTYDDPDAPVPDPPSADQRPPEHILTVSREAADTIAAASGHCEALAAFFGEDSREHLDAARSWQRGISGLFRMSFGAHSNLQADGPLSLIVTTGSFTYGLIFHRAPRRCRRPDCAAFINDTGQARTTVPGEATCPAGDHDPSHPLDAPAPGTWSFHS